MMAWAYFFAAVGMYFVHSYEMPVVGASWFYDLLCTCATLSTYPAFFLYLRGLTNLEGIKKQDYNAFWAPGIITIGTIFCDIYMISEGGIQETMDYLNAVNGLGYIPQGSPWIFYLKRAIGSYGFRLIAIAEAAFLVTYAFFGIRNYNKVMHEFYTTVDAKVRTSQRALIFSLFAICIGTALYASHSYTDTVAYKVSMIVATFLIALAALMMLYYTLSHKFNIQELRDLIEEADKNAPEEDDTVVLSGTMDKMRKNLDKLIEEQFYLDSSLTLISLAQMLGSNRTYVSNFIHTEYDLSFSDFINKMRVEYAVEQMKTKGPNFNPQELIEEAGFSSMPSFYRNFKKFTGSSPAKFASNN